MFYLSNYLGCIPLSEFKNPPPDQVGCEAEECPECKNKMWVSELKRKKHKQYNFKLICWHCLFDLLDKNGINLSEVNIVNMLKLS
jgi:hypothetical protein